MTEEEQNAVWPLPKFYFRVSIGQMTFACQEVSGLDADDQPIEYRAGNSKTFSTIKMPGLVRSANVTCKKLIVTNDNALWDWYSQIKLNTISRESAVIELLDQDAKPTMRWKLRNAWPTKITGTDMKSEGTEVAIETLELAHEGLTIENA